MTSSCRRTRNWLPRVDDEQVLPKRAEAHLAECLSCQAEAARYRRIRRQLQAMRRIQVQAPHDMVATVAEELSFDLEAPGRRHRVIEAAAATGAVVAIAGAVAILGWRKVGAA